MEDLDALLADLETTATNLSLEPAPRGKVPGGDTEQLYSTVLKPRPPSPGLGELDRLLRDLNATQSSITEELWAQGPPSQLRDPLEAIEDGAAPDGSGPPPGPPSAATQELDALMAALSRFHLQHPRPPSVGQDLDSLLRVLQKDLDRQGVPMGGKGPCGGCLKPIEGQALQALGRWWHPRHFRCAACGRELGESVFLERDGAPYCPEDYGRLFAPPCAACARPVLHEVVTALDKTWHPEHFCCTHCGGVLGEQGFLARGGLPFCPPDFALLFGARCRGCSGPIEAGFIAALRGRWHPACFRCAECSSPITGGPFLEANGRPLCPRHSRPHSLDGAAPEQRP